MSQTNKEKVLIRTLKHIKELNLTTSDIKFIINNLEQIYLDNYVKDRILKFIYNNPLFLENINK